MIRKESIRKNILNMANDIKVREKYFLLFRVIFDY